MESQALQPRAGLVPPSTSTRRVAGVRSFCRAHKVVNGQMRGTLAAGAPPRGPPRGPPPPQAGNSGGNGWGWCQLPSGLVVVLIAMAASTVAIALAAMNGLEKAAGRVEQGLEKAGWQVRQGLVEAGKEHATILSRASLGVGGLIIGLVLFWWRTGNAGGTRPEQGGAATGGTQVPAEGTANGGRRGF